MTSYSVTAIPEPDSTRYQGDDLPAVDRLAWVADDFEVSVWHPGEIQLASTHGWQYDWIVFEPFSPDTARKLAKALLAAARKADGWWPDVEPK